jgi:hypothetical protein
MLRFVAGAMEKRRHRRKLLFTAIHHHDAFNTIIRREPRIWILVEIPHDAVGMGISLCRDS